MNLTLLAGCLQALFTTRADELASAAHFIQRRNKLTGSSFLRALASVWGRHPTASYEQLALPLGIGRQSLFNRFTPAATAFCRSALTEALGHAFGANRQALPLLDRFRGVFLDDCTQLPLPDACAAEFAGCGSGVCELGKAGMKTFTRFEIQRGGIHHLSIHPARTADAKAAAQAPELPKGCKGFTASAGCPCRRRCVCPAAARSSRWWTCSSGGVSRARPRSTSLACRSATRTRRPGG